MTTALVTGSGGLIGAHIVRALLEGGLSPRALVRPGGSRRALADLDVECIEGDVMDAGALRLACEGCDLAFHAAAYFSYARDSLRELCEAGTENVLRAARAAGVRRVVVTSSSVVFGYRESEDAPPIDESEPISRDERPAYVAAKIAQYLRALAVADEIGLEVALTCPTITVGPTSAPLGASNGLILAYLNDPFCRTYPGGCNIAAAADVARGHLLVAERGEAGESYLLGAENLAWRDVHATIAELAGLRAPAFELNHTTAYLAAAAEELMSAIGQRPPLTTRDQAAMIGRCYWYSHAKAAHLGYAPQPARAALAAAVSWLAASPHVSREVRAGLRLSDEIYRLRAYDARESVG